ncbi:MAG: DEAD/DEAH box helicase [Phycisphaerae bacterium]|nr:DEAD/DEAH box helicase [Phycisphaerae bacterium]
MLIDTSNDTITIDLDGVKLRADQINQIKYWGFARRHDGKLLALDVDDPGVPLLKLLKYLDAEKIQYSVSPSCKRCVSEMYERFDSFRQVKAAGKKFKDGDFDRGEFKDFCSFVDRNVPRKLKQHQLKAAFHLYIMKSGANFSVPGSGKTAAILTVYEKLRLEGQVNLLFVVGPASCFGPWRTEFELTLGRKPSFRILAGGNQVQRKSEYFGPLSENAELYLTSFQTLLRDQDEAMTFLGRRGAKAFLVIDEAHYVKRIDGNWANAVLAIAEHAKYRCVLTGTPMPRSYTDVFNLFDFLWPAGEVIDSDTKIRLHISEEHDDSTSAKEILDNAIGPLFYRVRKRDLGLLAPVFHPPFVLPMNEYEKRIYDAIENRIRNYSKQDYLKNIDIVRKLRRGRIIRLRQCVSYVGLLVKAVEGYREELVEDKSDLSQIICDYDNLEIPAKLDFLKSFIDKMQQQNLKVVVWANFIDTLELIRQSLTQVGFYCKLIYGQTPIEQTSIQEEETREEIRDEFVDAQSGLDILVANPAACAESISLHKTCYHSIYYDLSYNCAQYLQSLDRIHRVGGSEEKQANYYFLQYENSIDQDVKINLDRKAHKMYESIEDDYGIYSLDMFEEEGDLQAFERLFSDK